MIASSTWPGLSDADAFELVAGIIADSYRFPGAPDGSPTGSAVNSEFIAGKILASLRSYRDTRIEELEATLAAHRALDAERRALRAGATGPDSGASSCGRDG